jgi:hypothetical protein
MAPGADPASQLCEFRHQRFPVAAPLDVRGCQLRLDEIERGEVAPLDMSEIKRKARVLAALRGKE